MVDNERVLRIERRATINRLTLFIGARVKTRWINKAHGVVLHVGVTIE